MNMQRKRWRIILSVVMIIFMIAGLCLVPGNRVMADELVTEDGFHYQKYSEDGVDKICITGYSGNETDIIIPGEIDGTPVRSLGEMAFYNTNITSVFIPESVDRMIKSGGLSGCRYLTSISVDENNTQYASLYGCLYNKGLSGIYVIPQLCENLYIPETVTYISWIPKGIKTINVDDNNEYFSTLDGNLYNKDMTEIIFCKRDVKSFTLPAGVTKIGDGAFNSCADLESIVIPDSVSEIGQSAFGLCSSLKEVTLPNGITVIAYATFDSCTSLTEIIIPQSVTNLGSHAFAGCKNLKRLVINSNEINLGFGAFGGCDALNDIEFSDTTVITELSGFMGCTGLKSFVVPGTVETIKSQAFTECTGLNTIVIPAGVTTIEEWAFRDCSDNLTIFGEEESEAERYALENGINFLPLSYSENPFEDVSMGKYYTAPVLWAVHSDPQITTGTSDTTFKPGTLCNRAQAVTFLWRMMGCPEPGITNNPFRDVSETAYYYKAVLWAVEKNITTGKYPDRFAPKDGCNRAQFVTFLWRAAGSPAPQGENNPFVDVDAGKYYTDAVLWASENQITTGTDETHFAPFKSVNRGQAVTFLYRSTDVIER